MEVAYLIMAHSNYEHLQRLVDAMQHKGAHFLLHIDKKAAAPKLKRAANLSFIDSQRVYWGGFSQVEVTLRLLQTALKNTGAQYFAFLSGVDYPIKPVNSFLELLAGSQAEFINIREGFQPTKPATRLTNFHFQRIERRKNSLPSLAARAVEKALALTGYKKQIPFKPFVGSNWFILSRDCIQYIFRYIAENPHYLKFHKQSLCADESFFQTIIGNSSFRESCCHNLTYADWSVPAPPAEIGIKHIELFQEEKFQEDMYGKFEPYFARKFSDNSKEIIDLIEQKLRA